MKKITTLLIIGICLMQGYAQSPRTVLLEHFTQASCPPCATLNPGITNYLNNTSYDIVSLKYQTSFPGGDPMYNFGQSDIYPMQQYYGVTSVPNSVIDGNYFNDHPNGWNNATFANRSQVTSPFELSIDYDVTAGFDSVVVTMIITASENYNGNMVAKLIVVEKEISFCEAPGSNGETEFLHVVKKMLPNSAGTALVTNWLDGMSDTITQVWANSSAYNPAEFGVVGYVQNSSTKEVLQATQKEFYDSPHQVEAMTKSLTGVNSCRGPLVCRDEDFELTTEIINLGSAAITSMDIEYGKFGGTPNIYSWTGNLMPAEKIDIALPAFASTAFIGAENLSSEIISINGAADDISTNNVRYIAGNVGGEAANIMKLELKTDRYGSETRWSIKEKNGTIKYAGGPYADLSSSGTTVQAPVNMVLDPGECYIFEITDSYGDGICCGYGAGSYKLIDASGVLVAQGSSFGAEDTKPFTTTVTSSIEDVVDVASFEVFPNPLSDKFATVAFSTVESDDVVLQVHGLLGELLMEKSLGELPSGDYQERIELPTSINNGVYLISLKADNDVITKKISVLR